MKIKINGMNRKTAIVIAITIKIVWQILVLLGLTSIIHLTWNHIVVSHFALSPIIFGQAAAMLAVAVIGLIVFRVLNGMYSSQPSLD